MTNRPYSRPSPPPRVPRGRYTRGTKDKGIALVLEILPGLFGFPGIGWIYGGETTTGVIILGATLVWDIIAFGLLTITGGLACTITVPINLVIVTVSSVLLNNHANQHPETFRA